MTELGDMKPLRDRPLMPNVHNIAGAHRGEPGPDVAAPGSGGAAVPAPGSAEVLDYVWERLAPGYDH
jgi:hypothetical protein